MKPDWIGEPQSLLDEMVKENRLYYQIFAQLSEPTGELFDPRRLLALSGGIQARFLVNALKKGYANFIAEDIINHGIANASQEYVLIEFGTAEGTLLARVLDYIQDKSPEFYERIKVYAVDFSVFYQVHNNQNLAKHLGKITFIRDNALVAKLPYADYFIMNEVWDDLPATTISYFRDEWNILAFQRRFNSGGKQCDLNYVPFSSEYICKDAQRVLSYLSRYDMEFPERQMNVYVGVGELLSLIESISKESARCYVMDYMYGVPGESGYGSPVDTDDTIFGNSGGEIIGATNIHCRIEFPQVLKLINHHGFEAESIFNLDGYGERPELNYFGMFLQR